MNALFGAALAGGAGRRMGGPKGGLLVGGVPLVVRALRALAPSVGALGVVGTAEGVPPSIPLRSDRRRGQGPLAGLETALVWAREGGHPGVAILACDLPLATGALTATLARRWRSAAEPPRAAVVAGTGADRQPLCAVYGVDLLEGLSKWLDAGKDLSVQSWLDTVDERAELAVEELGEAAGEPPGAALLNLNRPADLARAELLVDPLPPVVAVVGWKDAGKTTVAVALVAALRGRGLRVAGFKHGHGFRLDTPGTDSWRLRHEGGAERVILVGPEGYAAFGGWGLVDEPPLRTLVRRWAGDMDLVVAEGWKDAPVPAVEVLGRKGHDEHPPLWRPRGPDADRFIAIVGPGDSHEGPPLLAADDPELGERLAGLVLRRLFPGRVSEPES